MGRRLPLRLRQSRISLSLAAGLTLLLLAAGCDEKDQDGPYLELAGGGFVFNYRLAEAYYGFVVRVKRPLPETAALEATFEDPAGGPPLIVRQAVVPGRKGYKFESPPLTGVRTDRDYRVDLRLREGVDGRVIEAHARGFRSTVDQSVLPERPLTSGPGYHPPAPADGN